MTTGSFQTTGALHVRGASTYSRSADWRWLACARVIDFTFAAGIVGWSCAIFRFEPRPGFWLLSCAIFLPLGLFGLARLIWGRSAGDFAWGLSPKPQASRDLRVWYRRVFQPELLQPGNLENKKLLIGSILTIWALALASSGLRRGIFSHPLWRFDGVLHWDAAMPADSFPATHWAVGAFYYSLGSWPTEYRGQPVFHLIPYEKGPPDRFPGKVMARWDPPYSNVMIEGPKTPAGDFSRARIRECLAHAWSWGCAHVRDVALSRHIGEMQAALGDRQAIEWRVRWVNVRQPALGEEDWTQGMWIEAKTTSAEQYRFVALTPGGTHEAFVLSTNIDPTRIAAGSEALTTFERAIQGLRFSDQLGHGKVWIDKRLSEVRLAELERASDPAERLKLLAEVQFLLAAKITVEPGTFETYFHYGGLGVMLLKHAAQFPQDPAVESWTTAAKPTLEAAAQFAADLKPGDPRTKELARHSREAGR